MRYLPAILAFLLPSVARAQDDSFISGYATAILDREFGVPQARVEVHEGVITLQSGDLAGRERDKIVAALSRIKGVTGVRIDESQPKPDPRLSLTGDGWQVFPEGRIFQPLLADPRTPHFSLGYLRYTRSGFPKLRNAGSVSLGEAFNLLRYGSPGVGQFNLALEPAIFAIFNMDALSHDLVNADYRISAPMEYRQEWFSSRIAILHQSSHLGDEFLLDTPVQRVNYSFEAIDAKVAATAGDFRFYLGGQSLIHNEPAGLKRWSAQQGIEWMSTAKFISEAVAPLIAVDVQEHEETQWRASVSVRAGVELVNPEHTRRRIQFLLQYFRGYNPNGQFYREKVEWFGAGLHVYF